MIVSDRIEILHQRGRRTVIYALVAAALFGAGFPFCKQLLQGWAVQPLAGTLYLASGLGLLIIQIVIRNSNPLQKKDIPWLVGSVLFGGIGAPVALLYGLKMSHAYAGALLSNLECLFTALIAVLFFRERLSRAEWLAMILITVGAGLVALADPPTGKASHPLLGPFLLIAAFLCWGIDNNCTQRISHRSPLQIASIKGMAAGAINLACAAVLGEYPPLHDMSRFWFALLVGFWAMGVSLVMFVMALRSLGAARTAAYFATAPVFGVAGSLLLLGERPEWEALGGGVIMVLSVIWIALVHRKLRSVPV